MERRPTFDPVELMGPVAVAVLTAIVLGAAAAMIALSIDTRGGAEEGPVMERVLPVEQATPTGPATPAGPADVAALLEQGRLLADTFGCTACHSTDGSILVGPTWKGLFGKQETLSDGSTVTVDEAYIRESVLDPAAKVVQGFQPVMPSFSGRLTDGDIQALTEFIRSLE